MADVMEYRRVLVRPPNWLGDAVLALPAVAAIGRHFPGAALTIAAAPSVAALFREDTGIAIAGVIELPEAHRAAIAALATTQADLGILMPNSIRSAWQFRRAGIRHRWGMAHGVRDLLLTRRSSRPARRGLHQADYYRALVRGLDIACDDGPPTLRASQASLAQSGTLLSSHKLAPEASFIGVAPGAAYGQAKQWPPDRMAAVVARLLRTHDLSCVVVGAAHDRPAGRAIESWLRAHAPEVLPRVIDLIGRTSLGALAGVVSRCRVFVSNDSGAMHLAAALGCPVVALFGPTDERATRPLGSHQVITAAAFCRPCMLRDCPIDHRCMKRIAIETVYDAAARTLTAGA